MIDDQASKIQLRITTSLLSATDYSDYSTTSDLPRLPFAACSICVSGELIKLFDWTLSFSPWLARFLHTSLALVLPLSLSVSLSLAVFVSLCLCLSLRLCLSPSLPLSPSLWLAGSLSSVSPLSLSLSLLCSGAGERAFSWSLSVSLCLCLFLNLDSRTLGSTITTYQC